MNNNAPLPNTVRPENKADANKRTAVLFYGMLRNFKTGANSIKRNMLYDDHCEVYYFGPRDTDHPDINYTIGLRDRDGFFIENPKEKFQVTKQADTQEFLETYKSFIEKYNFHDMTFSHFEDISSDLRPREDWLMGLNPARMISMFYNMGGVVDMFLDHVGKDLELYEKIIITRTDLVVYSRIACILSGQEVHIPFGEGFGSNGEKYGGNASAFYYKNMLTGDYVPGGRVIKFNDQIMVVSGQDIAAFRNLFKTVTTLIRDHVPLSPETILYVICKRNNFTVQSHDEWQYEIYRDGKKHIESVLDIPDLANIDRYNPRLHVPIDDAAAKTTSDIICFAHEDFVRLRKGWLRYPLLSRKNMQPLSDRKILSFLLGSESKIMGRTKKSFLRNLRKQGIEVYTFRDDQIRSACAISIGKKKIILPKVDCHALYGPYIRLEPGHYTAEFIFDEIEGDAVVIDVSSPTHLQIAERRLKIKGDTVIAIDWELSEPHDNLEIRLFTSSGFRGIFDYLLIRKI